jgi:hypothetical protein
MVLQTASDVIDALGGTTAFATRFGITPQVASKWRMRGFPASTYPVLSGFLRSQGIEAAPSAFTFKRQKQAVE